MRNDAERYTNIIKEYYLRRKGSRKEKDRLEEFYTQLTPHELALIPLNKKILDAGAGDGLFAKLMEKKGNEVVCAELSDELIQLCKAKGLKCVKADLNLEIPFPDDYFDVVFCRTVIEHLFDPWQFLKESYRILKVGGELIVITSNTASIENRLRLLLFGEFPLDHDLKHWTPKSLKRALESAGFKVIFYPHLGKQLRLIEKLFLLTFFRSIVCIGIK